MFEENELLDKISYTVWTWMKSLNIFCQVDHEPSGVWWK